MSEFTVHFKLASSTELRLTHTERQALHQASAASEASDLCNGSGTHLEHQVKRHHRLVLVTLPLSLMLTLDVPFDALLDARCGYTLKSCSIIDPALSLYTQVQKIYHAQFQDA